MLHFLYILKSKTANKSCIGISQNPEERLEYQNTIVKGFTIRYRPLEVVYVEKYKTRAEGLKREKQLKSQKDREFISKLFKS